jgi:hypothetical protein
MSPKPIDVVPLLQRDIQATLGNAHRQLIEGVASDVDELGIEDKAAKIVNDVQQYFHDSQLNTTWPTCPRHSKHPLWYRDGSWWCVEDGVAVARLGELASAR